MKTSTSQRQPTASGGEMTYKRRNGMGRRLLSMLLVFMLIVNLFPTMMSNANAAPAPGTITDARIYADETGMLHMTGTYYPLVTNPTKGGFANDGIYFTGSDGSHGTTAQNTSFQWTDATKKEVATFDTKFWAETTGTMEWRMSIGDSFTGTTFRKNVTISFTATEENLRPLDQCTLPNADFVYAVQPGDGSFSYAVWTGQSNGRWITDYRVLWPGDGGTTWQEKLLTQKPVGRVDGAITGLSNGTEYQIKFQATNEIGTATSKIYKVTPGAASAPTNLQSTPTSGNQVTYTWDPPTDLHGGTLLRYELISENGASVFATITDIDNRTYVRTGTPGFDMSGWYIRAVTKDSAGKEVPGARSDNGFPTVRVGAPQRPAQPTVTVGTNGSRELVISWPATADNCSTPLSTICC